jgi:hypothetical protein
MKELDLITLEQEKRLEALGFDRGGDCGTAPTVALALQWIIEEKKITNFAISGITKRDKWAIMIGAWVEYYDSYNAAESALLDELLTLLGKEENHESMHKLYLFKRKG